ncbi:MAG: anaerobic ribonucleoside-triphosphate reductase activating protein [Nanoarchaeota archaeon]
MKIKGFRKMSLIDYPGKTCSIVFLGGCNFKCPFCQNPDLICNVDKIPDISEDEILNYIKGKRKWIDGVCMSVAKDERVLIKENKNLKNIPIEMLWNENKKTTYLRKFESQKCDKIEALTLNHKFQKVNEIIRHKTKEIYNIFLTTGYKVSATGSHSVFTLSKNGFITKNVSELKTKDYLLTPKKIVNDNIIKRINISNYFEQELKKSKKEMLKRKYYWIKIIKNIFKSKISYIEAANKYKVNRHTIVRYINAYKLGKLEEFCYNSKPNLLWIKNDFLWVGKNKIMRTKISVTKELAEFLGYTVAEGSLRKKSYTLSLGDEPKLAERVLSLYRKIFKSNKGVIRKRKSKTGNHQYSIIFGGKYVGMLLDKIVGHLAVNKKIPEIIFNTTKTNQRAFIVALNVGDGHIRERITNSSEEFSIKTISKQLVCDLIILLKFFGIHALITEEKEKYNQKRSYKIHFHGNQYQKLNLKRKVKTKYSFLTNIEGIPKEFLDMKDHIKYKKQNRINSDDVPLKYRNKVYEIAKKWNILKIKKITKNRTNLYVYDLVVPGNNSFIGGLGPILLHNTGGEPTLYNNLPEFIKKIKDMGFLVKLDTNGSNPEILKNLIDKKLVDYIAMDIKASLERYSEASGCDVNLDDIKKSVDIIRKSGVDYEFRTTILPRLFTKDDAIKIGKWLNGSKRFFLQQFRPMITLDRSFENENSYSKKELREIAEIMKPYFDLVVIRD